MRFEIIDRHGEVLNTIEASAEWMEENYPPQPIIVDNNEGPDEFWPQYRQVEIPASPEVVTVTMAQARKALILSGVSMMDVEAALASIPDDTARALAQIDWEYSTTVRSNSPLVQSIGAQLELDIDSLFALAVTL